MADETTIDKKTFSVDMKLVWACGLGLAYFVNQGTTRFNTIESDIKALQSAPAQVEKVRDAQARTDSDLKDLKSNFEALRKSQEEIKLGQEKINSSLEGLNAQVSAIRAALPQQGRRQ